MKKLYLSATIVGAAVPLYFFAGFFAEHGFGLTAFLEASFANRAASGLISDLLLSALIAFVFIGKDAKRLGINRIWLVILGTCLIGLSFGLPLSTGGKLGSKMSAPSHYADRQRVSLAEA